MSIVSKNAFIAEAGNGHKTWDFRFFLPLNPPPKGENELP
jgi:hypothetical protein